MTSKQLGWNAQVSRAFEACGVPGVPGRVAAVERGRCVVWSEDGEFEAASTEPVVAGDWVVVRDGRVAAVLPRRNRFSRKRPGEPTVEQVIAANLDVLLIVAGLDGDFNLRRLERYLVAAAASRVRPVVVLNKADLCPSPGERLAEVRGIAPEVEIALTSALTGDGLDALWLLLAAGETAALVGSSGVGKSSLVNRLLGQPVQAVQEVRKHDSHGRHTTVRRELFPVEAGWLLMDTPGMREIQPWDAAAGIEESFADITALAQNCRFRDCSHASEPGCAVLEAAGTGALHAARLQSYRSLQAEARYLERKTDVHAALEEKRRWRSIHKSLRKLPRNQ